MTDEEIVALYWQRSDRAIDETARCYGGYCYTVAYALLSNQEDAEESVNDTYLAAWNAIPPTRPQSLKAFLGQITRRLALSRLRRDKRLKRGGGEAALAIEELAECIPSGFDTEKSLELKELAGAIGRFLESQDQRDRRLFTARYWYALPVERIAAGLGMRPGAVRTALHRLRRRLAEQLQKEGLL